MPRIGRAVIHIGDLDRALEFYTRAFDFHVLFDEEIVPGFRSVHVGPGTPGDGGIWLFPGDVLAEKDEPVLVLFSDEFDVDVDRIRSSGASVAGDPAGETGARHISVLDPWGNIIVVAES